MILRSRSGTPLFWAFLGAFVGQATAYQPVGGSCTSSTDCGPRADCCRDGQCHCVLVFANDGTNCDQPTAVRSLTRALGVSGRIRLLGYPTLHT